MSLPGTRTRLHRQECGWGWQGCHPSWPEGHCGFECADSFGALRQVPGAGCRQDNQGQEQAKPQLLGSAQPLLLELHGDVQKGEGSRHEGRREGGAPHVCQVFSEVNELFSPSFVYK